MQLLASPEIDIKAAVINMFKKLKEGMMTMTHQIENIKYANSLKEPNGNSGVKKK